MNKVTSTYIEKGKPFFEKYLEISVSSCYSWRIYHFGMPDIHIINILVLCT